MSLTREEVARVAALARLELSEAELDRFTAQLGQVLEHAADMAGLDLAGVAPTSHPFGLVNVLRDDAPGGVPRPRRGAGGRAERPGRALRRAARRGAEAP